MQDKVAQSPLQSPSCTNTHNQPAQLAELIRINTDDILAAFGLAQTRLPRRLLDWLCYRPAHRFARQVLGFDDMVATQGLQVAGTRILQQFVQGLDVSGQEHVPLNGPLLIVSNHPGLYDTAALFATIPRPDLRIVAADRPFLRILPHTSRYLIAVGTAPAGRLGVVRLVTRHLRNGGAVLTFPGGQIEPDPAVQPGAIEALEHWSDSMELFVRMAPALHIVPVVVSGVFAAQNLRHPLIRLRREAADRERLAAMLQLVFPQWQTIRVRVAFGRPIHVAEDDAAAGVSHAVQAEMRRLMMR